MNLFGHAADIVGDLTLPQLTGSLAIEFGPNEQPDTGQLDLEGQFQVVLSRNASNQLVGTLNFDGVLVLPTWLAAASPNQPRDAQNRAVAGAHGTFKTNGEINLSLMLSNFKLGPGGVIQLVGAGGVNTPATFDFHRTKLSGNNFANRLHIDGMIALGQASGVPLLAIVGDLSDQGSGALAIAFGTQGLNLGGFSVTGGATLNYSPTTFNIAVNGMLSVPGLVNNATVTGTMDQNGIQQLTIGASGFTLSPVVLSDLALSLVRSGTNPNFTYNLHVQGKASFGSFFSNLGLAGDLNTQGNGSLNLTLGSANLAFFGFPVASAANSHFTLIKSGMAVSLDVLGNLTFLNQSLVVKTLPNAPLTLAKVGSSNRITGALAVQFNSGQTIGLGGFGVGGTATLTLLTTSARLDIVGTTSIPGIVGAINVSGFLASNGTGTLTVAAPNGLKVGGTNSPLKLTGTFSLGSTAPGTFFFNATNATVDWSGIASFGVNQFFIASDGRFDLDFGAKKLIFGNCPALPASQRDNCLWLNVPASHLHVDPRAGQQKFELQFGDANNQLELSVPGIATGTNRLDVPPITININSSDFSKVLASGELDLGLLTITGRLVFKRESSVYKLTIEDIPQPGPDQPPTLEIPGLVELELDEYVIASNGTFTVSATADQIGPDALSIQDFSVSISKTGAALSTFAIAVNGGELHLPFGDPIDLPNISFDSNGSFTKDFTFPQVELGDFFEITGNTTFTASASGGVLMLRKKSTSSSQAVSISALAGSADMKLKSFEIDSNGNFSGQVTGKLGIGDYQLAQATFDLSKSGSNIKLTLPASAAASVDVGFMSASFHGFAKSNGDFSFTATASATASALGFSIDGSIDFTISSDDFFDADFSGQVCAPFIGCANVSGGVSASGVMTVTILGQSVTIDLDDFNL